MAPLYMLPPGMMRVLDWRRREQAGAGWLQEVVGCLAPFYLLPPGVLRVLGWRRKEQAVGRDFEHEGEQVEEGAVAGVRLWLWLRLLESDTLALSSRISGKLWVNSRIDRNLPDSWLGILFSASSLYLA